MFCACWTFSHLAWNRPTVILTRADRTGECENRFICYVAQRVVPYLYTYNIYIYRCMCRELNDSDGLCVYIILFIYIQMYSRYSNILWHINADDDDTTHTIIQFKMVAWENPLILNTDHSSLHVCIVLVLRALIWSSHWITYILLLFENIKYTFDKFEFTTNKTLLLLLLVGDSISKLYLLWFKRNYILQPPRTAQGPLVRYMLYSHILYNPFVR